MQSVLQQIEARQKKKAVVDVRSGDNVRVHQKIVEGGKERIQIFEGLVIRTRRKNSLSSCFTVRRIASGVGVEKTYLIHSPNVLKVEVVKRSKVRRNYISYMRGLTGKSARLSGMDFDKDAVNTIKDEEAEAEEAKIQQQQLDAYDPEAAKKEKAEEKAEAQAAASELLPKKEPSSENK
ncbi:50S ribosomal protein L19 [Candidatus Saccharibacteria bacterium]|nr:50S ribosomal protein L19 [Candidatus Saccharibacteria bacterium]